MLDRPGDFRMSPDALSTITARTLHPGLERSATSDLKFSMVNRAICK